MSLEKYQSIPAVQRNGYNVPQDFFVKHYDDFAKSYKGTVNNGKKTVKAPPWRAFEILFVLGKLPQQAIERREREKNNADSNKLESGSKESQKAKAE